MSLESAQYATLGVGVVNVAMTFVSAILMDRAGRRTLHLYGLAVMFIFADLLTVSFLWKVQNRASLFVMSTDSFILHRSFSYTLQFTSFNF